MGENVMMTDCLAVSPRFRLSVRGFRPVAHLDRCKGIRAGASMAAESYGIREGVWGPERRAKDERKTKDERRGGADSDCDKVGSLIQKMMKWGECGAVEVIREPALSGETREVGFAVLCPYSSTTFILRMVGNASPQKLAPASDPSLSLGRQAWQASE